MLITPEDLDRLARLEIDRDGDHDVVWACRLARKLAWLKPTEAEYQEYLGMINQISCTAYSLRHDETLFIRHVVGSGDPKFVQEFSCAKMEAFLCVRPYVILESPKSPDILYILETHSSWKVRIGEKTLASGWLAEILVGLDGYGIRRKPYVFMPPKEPIDNVFCAGIVESPRVDILGGYGPTISPVSTLGVFLGGGTKLEMSLVLPKILSEDPTIKLSMGLVAARYTTKPKRMETVPVPAA